MTVENVREVAMVIELEGQGIVQTDSSEFKHIFKKCVGGFNITHDNNIFAKSNLYKNPDYVPTPYKDGDGEASEKVDYKDQFIRKIKISGACLRHAIHEDVMPFHSPMFFQNKAIRQDILTSKDYHLRGHLSAPNKQSDDSTVIKMASAYTITDAEVCNDAVSRLEVRTTAGARDATSYFYEETQGTAEYRAIGIFNFATAQFISSSVTADRMALSPEDCPLFVMNMTKKYGADSFKEGYFHLNNAAMPVAESGYLLSEKYQIDLLKHLLKKIVSINITKRSSYAKVKSVKIKYIVNPLTDLVSDPEGWLDVYDSATKTLNLELDITPKCFYSEATLDEIVKHNLIAEEYNKQIQANLAKKEKSDAEKKKNKA